MPGVLDKPVNHASAFVESCGARIHIKSRGDGDDVLLLHGWGASTDSMGLLFESLAKTYRVTAIDFPGHGNSGPPPEPWGVAQFADCLLGVMNTLGLNRPHMVAHSFGGRVAIRLAAHHSDRVGKLVLVDSAGIRPPRPPKYYFKIALAKIGKLFARFAGKPGQALRKAIYARIASKDYASAGALRETFVKVVNEDQQDLLSRIKSPTLLVWGANDTDTPLASGRKMQKLIPASSLVVLDNAGHFSYLDQPTKFDLSVRRFLRSEHNPAGER